MSKKKLSKDISASAVQVGITQVFNLVIFYLISKYLAKDIFGQYNWATAVGSTIITVASLGLDLIYVKRVASDFKKHLSIGLHFFHTLFSGLILCMLLLIVQFIFPSFTAYPLLFLLVFLNLIFTSIANSLKLCLNGIEEYNKLAIVSICANVFKFAVVLLLFVTNNFSIYNIITGFILTSLFEFCMSYWFAKKRLQTLVKPIYNPKEYKEFIVESLPQLGVVLFDSALARIDWILLGILSTDLITAEYSFAYKFFELSKLPLIVLSPILLTRFSKILNSAEKPTSEKINFIGQLFKLEMFIAMLIPIVMISVWSDFIDYFTNNKYGQVNEITYRLLAVAVPVHYINNFLWTIGFVKGQLKTIMFITIAASLSNVLANVILIPFYGGIGAAIAFLASSVFQLALYIFYTKQDSIRLNFKLSIISFLNASVSVTISLFLDLNYILTAILAIALYLICSLITGTLSKNFLNDIKNISHN